MQIRGITFPPSVVEHLAKLQPRDSKRGIPLIEVMAARSAEAAEALIPHLLKWAPDFYATYKTMLDIGCDIAIIDAMLGKMMPSLETIYLMDGDGKAKRIDKKFSTEQRAWNNVQLGYDMVIANVPKLAVYSIYPNPAFSRMIDFIISLKSWGHHYPVQTYIALAKECLSKQGLIVLDIREGTDGIAVMEQAGFQLLDRIPDKSPKCKRLLFRRAT